MATESTSTDSQVDESIDDANDSLTLDTADETTTGQSTDATASGDNAAVTDDAATSSTSPDADAWRKPYEELGFQNIETPEQAHQRLMEAYRMRDQQARETQEQLRYMQSIHSRLESLGGSQQQASPAPESNKPADLLEELTSGWVVPDRELLAQYVVTGEDGRQTWAPDAPAELRAQVDAYKVKKANWLKVLDDPRQLDQAISQRVERMLSQRLDETLTQRDTMTADARAEQQFLTDNQWIFDRDPVTGGSAIDPATGQLRLSQEGQLFTQVLNRVRESGVSRRQEQLEMAMALYERQQARKQQAPVQQRTSVQPMIDQQRAAMLGQRNTHPAKPKSAAGINDGKGGSRTGASRESWGTALVRDLMEERV